MQELNWLTAHQAAEAIRKGEIGCEELVSSCLQQIETREDEVQAWAFLDPEHALRQARAADQHRLQGLPTGPLHGVPVGIKDIIDTADMPTEDGSVLHAGRMPERDATVVNLLRGAGAIVLGKTVTTELATYAPGKTRNPHNPAHTPGGSSSGSAAAVASGMVPLALGTQTNGSLIRPAAYCGIFGFKPTLGWISRHGVLRQSPALDHVGMFARSIQDLALLGEQIVGYDAQDSDTRPRARPPLLRVALEEPPATPNLAFVRTPMWQQTDADTQGGFAELLEHLASQVAEFELPPALADALEWHRTIMEADIAASFEGEYTHGKDKLSASLRQQIERGRKVLAVDYRKALARIPLLNDGFDELFDRFDAILTPAVQGTAPLGLASTGNPMFCTLWTLCGMPAVSLPLLQGENGLPIGVQLVGKRGDDARLLRTANWLMGTLE